MLVAWALSFALTTTPAIPNTQDVVQAEETKVQEAKEEIVLPYTLKTICSCESTGSPDNEPVHYDKEGKVLLGKINPDDVGMCQINTDPEITDWLRISQEKGYDIWTPDGNKLMAIWIYETYGTQPWVWSKKPCWGKRLSTE